jgi:hypothetical protein
VATPQPKPPDQTKPDETPDEPKELSQADKAKIRRWLALAKRASKARNWRRAKQLASEILKLQPDNQQAARISKLAASKVR